MTPTGETHAPTTPPAKATDPAVAGLFRMSRTAGVGLQDYAAVNVLAVTGLLLGLASFLAVIVPETLAILIVPAAAAVVCVVAFVQVRRSNGTQTGLSLALIGLALAVLFAGIHLYGYARTSSTEKAWTAELNQLANKLHPTATTQQADAAYQLFDDRFREQVTAETFARQMQMRMQFVEKVGVGSLVVYEKDESGLVIARTLLQLSGTVRSADGTQTRPFSVDEPVEFRKLPGQPWQVHGITGWFGATKPAGAQPGVAPAGR